MFQHYKRNGRPAPFEKYPVTGAEAVAVGEALVLSSGKLTKCGATAAPSFIAQEPCTGAEATAGKEIAVVRVSKDVIYETELTADFSAIAAGAKVTLASTGLGVTATTTSGVAEIVGWDGKASGDKVRVRF